MKTIVKQIFRIIVDIILSISWGGVLALNSVLCAIQYENRGVFIALIVFSSILFISKIISISVDTRELDNLCNLYDDRLKQTLFSEKEVQNAEDKS